MQRLLHVGEITVDSKLEENNIVVIENYSLGSIQKITILGKNLIEWNCLLAKW